MLGLAQRRDNKHLLYQQLLMHRGLQSQRIAGVHSKSLQEIELQRYIIRLKVNKTVMLITDE